MAYRVSFTKGEKVWWTNGWSNNMVHYGIIKTISGRDVQVLEYNEFMQPVDWREIERIRLNKFVSNGLRNLNEAIKLINIGRLQYNQHFFRSSKKKKQKIHWRSGYEQYKRLCKEYGVPVSPKRPVSNVSEEW